MIYFLEMFTTTAEAAGNFMAHRPASRETSGVH
jgi:hypothetical protein